MAGAKAVRHRAVDTGQREGTMLGAAAQGREKLSRVELPQLGKQHPHGRGRLAGVHPAQGQLQPFQLLALPLPFQVPAPQICAIVPLFIGASSTANTHLRHAQAGLPGGAGDGEDCHFPEPQRGSAVALLQLAPQATPPRIDFRY